MTQGIPVLRRIKLTLCNSQASLSVRSRAFQKQKSTLLFETLFIGLVLSRWYFMTTYGTARAMRTNCCADRRHALSSRVFCGSVCQRSASQKKMPHHGALHFGTFPSDPSLKAPAAAEEIRGLGDTRRGRIWFRPERLDPTGIASCGLPTSDEALCPWITGGLFVGVYPHPYPESF